MATTGPVTMEFHVSRAARERYHLDGPWFSLSGNVVFADLATTRRLAQRMNDVRGAAQHPGRSILAGELHAMGLIDEILHYVAALYRRERGPDVIARALATLDRRLGRERMDEALREFSARFPPLAVHRAELGVEEHLAGATAGVTHRELALEEMLMLRLANENPAFEPFRELFDDAGLGATAYREVGDELAAFFATQPTFGPDDQSLVDMLRSPALASPSSLQGQLDYIRRHWGHLLGELLTRLLVTMDVIREDQRAHAMRFGARAWDRAPMPVTDYRGLEGEAERFTPDRDWMPRSVMIAKSAHVWLDQLSRAYGRDIHRLDEVPDDELERVARWGINALWLIGLWERSPASKRIKQRCGNPEAEASAYSLLEYRIADALGGAEACARLRERAGRLGIRLASDMVPNHMGIDSRWVMEHPERFLSLDQSPYPGYTFDGPDLSWDSRVGIFLEDHYYDRTDAAVVFKRVDRATGETRFVYHGNDGTLTPWNDTAQLDYLNARVRAAVLAEILEVARSFPIIRLDAAMTLAKRHYQRLWFPEPGTGGAIPSRAERGLTRAEFERAMPVEFWREVVDRVAAERPDTLLLAEAFWLMEGYFVRTLGMHRVYNSAFMNMLRDEENANYRAVIRNTLEFDPEVLKRYVNFMSNPDERTAIDQFGTGDKYFGVCTLMATLPGMPMFGHGQVEGFGERYGMEFRRATREERPNQGLVERHEREIFPLLRRRAVFAEARDFLLYDFFTADGRVNEDVFAYSNRSGEERGLVLYHNRYADTAGWVRMSAAYAVREGGDQRLQRRSLADGLGVGAEPDAFCRFRDQVTGLEFLRGSLELHERGLYARLEAYRCQVFLDFREVRNDADHPWAQLAQELGGNGVPSLDRALEELRVRAVLQPFAALVAPEWIRRLEVARAVGPERGEIDALARDARAAFARLIEGARSRAGGSADPATLADELETRLLALVTWQGEERPVDARQLLGLWCGVLLETAAGLAGDQDRRGRAHEWYQAWGWTRATEDAYRGLGASPDEARRGALAVLVVLEHRPAFERAARGGDPAGFVAALLVDERARAVFGAHEHRGVRWFHRESWEDLIRWLAAASEIDEASDRSRTRERAPQTREIRRLAATLRAAAESAGYRLDDLPAALEPKADPARERSH